MKQPLRLVALSLHGAYILTVRRLGVRALDQRYQPSLFSVPESSHIFTV